MIMVSIARNKRVYFVNVVIESHSCPIVKIHRTMACNSPKDELYRLIIISVSTAISASLFCAVRNVLRDNRVELGLRPFAR